jgi:hypothetical protein
MPAAEHVGPLTLPGGDGLGPVGPGVGLVGAPFCGGKLLAEGLNGVLKGGYSAQNQPAITLTAGPNGDR